MRTFYSVTVLIAAACLTGCATKSATIANARGSYDAGNFDSAHDVASSVALKSSGIERTEAAYLAGVSAYRQGDFATAERDFSMAMQSADPVIVGRTNATLGLMRRAENRTASAAGYFEVAAETLGGEDGAIAARRAAESYRSLGRSYEAEGMIKLAAANSAGGTPHFGTSARTRDKSVGEYTIQLGAFSNRANANSIAKQVTSVAIRLGIGQPSVNARTVRGLELHVVRVGSFSSHADAEVARRQLGAPDSVVASVSD